VSSLLHFIGDWGHALAAVLFAALGIFVLRRRDDAAEQRLLAAALLLTSCWSLYVSFGGVEKPLTGIGENIRNAAWLLLLFAMMRRNGAARGEPCWRSARSTPPWRGSSCSRHLPISSGGNCRHRAICTARFFTFRWCCT